MKTSGKGGGKYLGNTDCAIHQRLRGSEIDMSTIDISVVGGPLEMSLIRWAITGVITLMGANSV